MNKRDSIDKAKSLMSQNSYSEAAKIFNEVQEAFADEINGWDVFFMIKCVRAGGEVRNIDELAEKHKDFDNARSLYVWLLYDRHVKIFDSKDAFKHEEGIRKLLEYSEQKDFSQDDADAIPCPYTLGVFKIIKHYKKPNFNISKIDEWTQKLVSNKLSRKENVFTDKSGKERRIASPYEDYYATLSTLNLKQEKYKECIEICDYALANINNLHYDNDIWFKRRKATSMIKLGMEEKGFELLLSLSKNRKGDKWFIYVEIAEVYFENEDYENALEFCIKGIKAYGDEAFKINLLILTARTLFKLQRMDDATILAKYMLGMSLVHELKEKNDLKRIVDYFKIDKSSIEEPKKYLSEHRRKVDEIFKIDRNAGKKKKKNFGHKKPIEIKPGDEVKGWVKTVHGNGKSGHVIANKEAYFFSMNDIQADKAKIERGVNVMLVFKGAKDKDGKPAKHAVILGVIE